MDLKSLTIKIELNEQDNNMFHLINLLNEHNYRYKIDNHSQEKEKSSELKISLPPPVHSPGRYYHEKEFGRYGLTVLEQLAEGASYSDIANHLDISMNGVRYYIKKVFKILNVNNGRDALRIYLTDISKNPNFINKGYKETTTSN